MSEIVCSRCGHPNSENANFCSSCGYSMGQVGDETTEHHVLDFDSLEETPVTSGTFVVRRGNSVGAKYSIDAGTTAIGRHPESQIFLDDVTVSRRHAEVRIDQGTVVLRDAGSLNGTYLNRERIEETRLRSGDEVQIGKFKLVFLVDNT